MKTFNSKQTEVILVYFVANKQLGGMLFCSDAPTKKRHFESPEIYGGAAHITLPCLKSGSSELSLKREC